jgi:hypothetical protein
MSEEEQYISINELTEKLQDEVDTVKKKEKDYRRENDSVVKENLEKFILEKASELVVEGLDTIKELKGIFVSNPNAEEIDSLAQSFKAVSSALSILKDMQVSNSKIESNKELKEMEIKAKRELLENKSKEAETQKILLTREEVMKQLIDKSEIIEAEFVPVTGDKF